MPQALKTPERALICGIFHGNLFLFPKNHRKQHQQVVISSPHNDLGRTAVDSSGMMEIIGNRLPKTVFSLRISQLKQFRVRMVQHIFGDLLPGIVWKSSRLNSADSKIPAIFRLPFLADCLRLPLHPFNMVQFFHLTGKISPVRDAFQIPFRDQLFIRQFHGTAAYLQITAERAGRRQTLPGEYLPSSDFFSDIIVNLLI